MSNLLYGKVESYFALVKWIKNKREANIYLPISRKRNYIE